MTTTRSILKKTLLCSSVSAMEATSFPTTVITLTLLKSFSIVTVANEAVPNFKSVLLVNSFSYVDQILEDALYKAIEQFQNCPMSRPEMCYNFLSVLLHSK